MVFFRQVTACADRLSHFAGAGPKRLAVPLLPADPPLPLFSMGEVPREDRAAEKIVTRLPKVGKSRARLAEKLRGPDDRVSAQRWREVAPFRERSVERDGLPECPRDRVVNNC